MTSIWSFSHKVPKLHLKKKTQSWVSCWGQEKFINLFVPFFKFCKYSESGFLLNCSMQLSVLNARQDLQNYTKW